MAEEPPSDADSGTGSPELSPRTDLLHRTVPVRIIVIVLAVGLLAGASIAVGYFLGHGKTHPVATGSTPTVKLPASTSYASRTVSPSPTNPSAPASSSAPSAAAATSVSIPMAAACKWAYPGQASGKFSGSDYSIVCLGTDGQILGGFSGTNSLNAWCAEPQHTDGKDLPSPALLKGTWSCTGSGSKSQPTPAAPATSQAAPVATPTAQPSSSLAVGPVPIPIAAACEWAYPGQASGKFSGSDYSIVCLGTDGQILGGFSGTHSLNAWCAEPQHTDGKDLPSPALVDGQWLCTA